MEELKQKAIEQLLNELEEKPNVSIEYFINKHYPSLNWKDIYSRCLEEDIAKPIEVNKRNVIKSVSGNNIHSSGGYIKYMKNKSIKEGQENEIRASTVRKFKWDKAALMITVASVIFTGLTYRTNSIKKDMSLENSIQLNKLLAEDSLKKIKIDNLEREIAHLYLNYNHATLLFDSLRSEIRKY